MTLRRDTRAAGGIDTDVFLGVECLCEEGVGDDADVGAEPDELDFVIVHKGGGEGDRAECRLFDNGDSSAHKGLQRIRDLPARRAVDTVLYGEFSPLLRLKIIRAMRIHGEDERRARRLFFFELCCQTRQHLLRLGRTECAVYEVVLHIDNDDCLFHNVSPSMPMNVLFSPKSAARSPRAAHRRCLCPSA